MGFGGLRMAAAAVALSVAAAVPAMAADMLVVVENRDYRAWGDIRDTLRMRGIEDAARAAGYEIEVIRDADAETLQSLFGDRYRAMLNADRLVVVLSGHVVTDGAESWLVARDAKADVDGFRIGASGLRIGAILDLMAENPGSGLLAVVPGPARRTVGPGMDTGFGAVDLPQGVTVIEGAARAMSRALTEDILSGARTVRASAADRGLEAAGYLPRRIAAAPQSAAGVEAPGTSRAQSSEDTERDVYRAAVETNTAAAYRDYLRRYPEGRFRDIAEFRLATLEETPEQRAEAAEAALNLSRDARREIQRNLSILDHDPRGIDGIFGPGTRAAIRSWQAAAGVDVTGFLNGNQVARLKTAAQERQAALEQQARQRQLEEDRKDGAYWQETGRGETVRGMRQYLERYPDGLFSELARDRLDAVERQARQSARAEDRGAWQSARETNTIQAYRQYLRAQPQGAFRENAEARIAQLRRAQNEGNAAGEARAAESGVLANPVTRLLVERRLAQLGLDPGAADGTFDNETRRAIRRFQRARDLPVTGFVDQRTLVRMLGGN